MRRFTKAGGILLGVLLGFAPLGVAAQPTAPAPTNTIRGRILDSESQLPLATAEVILVGTGHRTFTDDDGRFVLERIPSATYTLGVTRLGDVPLRRELVVVAGREPAPLDRQRTRSA